MTPIHSVHPLVGATSLSPWRIYSWVDAVWALEFTEAKEFDDPVEEELSAARPKHFKKLYDSLLVFTQEESVWAVLQENGVSVKTLVAVLSFFVFGGKCKNAGVQQRVSALHAASVYLLLLGLPGSIANKAFHGDLLDLCTDVWTHCWPQDSGKKRKKDPPKSSQTEVKRAKPRRKNVDDEDEEEEEEDAAEHFSGQDLSEVRAAVVLLVQSLLRLLQVFSLKDFEQNVKNCTQVRQSLQTSQNISDMKSVPEMAFHGLQLLCSPKHGQQEKVSLRTSCLKFKFSVSAREAWVRALSVLRVLHEVLYFTSKNKFDLFCEFMVEKSEFRCHGAQAVGRLSALCSSAGYAWFVRWLSNFSQHSKVKALTRQPERSPEGCDPTLLQYLPHKYLIQEVLFSRRMDVSPTVQGHALSCLAQCLELPSMNATRAVQGLFTTSERHSLERFTSLRRRFISVSVCFMNLEHILRRVKQSNTNVRKSALQVTALVGLLKHDVVPSTWDNLSVLASRCRDPAVSVKKKALQCVGETLSVKPCCGGVQVAWLEGVCSAVMDAESSVQERALEALDDVLLSHIKIFSENTFLDRGQRLAWDLLDRLCHDCHTLSRYLTKAFDVWLKQGRFTPMFFRALVSHTGAPHAAGAWLLLSKISSTSLPCGEILDAWDKMTRSVWNDVNSKTLCNVLCVIGDVAPQLNADTQRRIIGEFKGTECVWTCDSHWTCV
uniref:Non-SMC condensin II complex, subunit D3 n=1 Tax=Periophthalmus magnuspinnatus TaxID=409849 RepID=A0A3B4AMU5_9GOBI